MPRGELEFIRRVREVLNLSADSRPDIGPVPFGDDMAGVPGASPPLFLTTDMLMDGVDFRSGEHAWRAIGRKAVAVNLSDCAAMAVRPVAALCALALNDRLTTDDGLDLMRGAAERGGQFDCPVIGGDTNTWTAPTAVCVTVAAVQDGANPPVRRNGAKPGDWLCVTGPLGGSILGRHMTFEPRVELALRLNRELRPRAMIDISDGFALDLWRVLWASGCGAEIHEPEFENAIHRDARRLSEQDGRPAIEHALEDGEDFELIVAVSAEVPREDLERHSLLVVGRFTHKAECTLLSRNGGRRAVEPRGWEHFQ